MLFFCGVTVLRLCQKLPRSYYFDSKFEGMGQYKNVLETSDIHRDISRTNQNIKENMLNFKYGLQLYFKCVWIKRITCLKSVNFLLSDY